MQYANMFLICLRVKLNMSVMAQAPCCNFIPYNKFINNGYVFPHGLFTLQFQNPKLSDARVPLHK